jgi:hypothetical protein
LGGRVSARSSSPFPLATSQKDATLIALMLSASSSGPLVG